MTFITANNLSNPTQECAAPMFQFVFEAVLFRLRSISTFGFPIFMRGIDCIIFSGREAPCQSFGRIFRHGVIMPCGLDFPRYSEFNHASPHEGAILSTKSRPETNCSNCRPGRRSKTRTPARRHLNPLCSC